MIRCIALIWMCRLKQIRMDGEHTYTLSLTNTFTDAESKRENVRMCARCVFGLDVCYFQFMFKLVSVFCSVCVFFSSLLCCCFMLPFAIISFFSFLFLCRFWFRSLTDIPYLFHELKEETPLHIWFPHMKYRSKWQSCRNGKKATQTIIQPTDNIGEASLIRSFFLSFFLFCLFSFRFDIDPKLFIFIRESTREEKRTKRK